MTRRITLAILLTTWALLIVGGVCAYVMVRWALIAQLDHSLWARASTIPELSRAAGDGATDESGDPAAPNRGRPGAERRDAIRAEADRYMIRTAGGQPLSPAAGGASAVDLKPISASFSPLADGGRQRVVTLSGTAPLPDGSAAPVTVIYQSSAAELDRLLDRLAMGFTVFGTSAGLLTALAARLISRAALRPLRATAEAIGTIEPRHLDRRIDAARLPPELVPVAGRLNEMLEKIERAYAQRQQFLADASHELRTPVAAMVTTAEVTLRRPRTAPEYAAALTSCLDDARLLRVLVERLMEQCRADTLSHDEPVVEADLALILAQCADQAAALGQSRDVQVRRTWPEPCPLLTQPGRVRSIVQNLIANAVEHNRPGGTVELVCQPNGQAVHLEVRDTGPGIAPEHLPHLFEPFYRVDKVRSHEVGHMGLGLALVQAHLHALKGDVRVESAVGQGTTFHLTIPRANAGAGGA